jgi:glyoxylase-like metal-dependent hydrolase (beta-lactamase superfamily II)
MNSSAEAAMADNLNVTWIHGSPDCAKNTDPPIQAYHFNRDTIILRQSKCSEPATPEGDIGPSFEAPFMYLLIGANRALLLDTGASRSAAVFPIASTIRKLLNDRATTLGALEVPLTIAHSHSHHDHFAGDNQFHSMPNVTIVPPELDDVKRFFGLPAWPDGATTVDLGSRTLDVIPIPGHEKSHIALYDRNTQILLTGDSLYPGLLVVEDWFEYIRSIARLKAFVDANPVSFILGAHIEMTNEPGVWFGLPTLYQSNEHVLQLERHHLVELHEALSAIGSQPRTDRHADFIIYPEGQSFPPLKP